MLMQGLLDAMQSDIDSSDRPSLLKDIPIGERPIFKCAAFDETEHWRDDIKQKIGENGKIYSVYIYDETVGDYCCEMRPFYVMEFFEYITEMGWEASSEKEQAEYDSIIEEINETYVNDDVRYERHGQTFQHEAVLEDWNTVTDEKELDKTVEEAKEDLLERLRCNGGCWNALFLKPNNK